MEFSYNDDQMAIRDLVQKIFADRASDSALQQLSRESRSHDPALWAVLAEQGLLGVALPEDVGGSGLGLTELCLILEEQGRSLAPVPLLASLVLGALPIARFGSSDQQQQWLRPLIQGAITLSATIGTPANAVEAKKVGDEWQLNGVCSLVPDAVGTAAILVSAASDSGDAVFVVSTDLPGITLLPQQITLLGERAARLTLNNVKVPTSAVLGELAQGPEILQWLEQRAHIAHCALLLGVCEEAMRRTAAYLGERQQFGVPLGTFQALAMRMADSYIDVEAMRSTYWLAKWRLSENLDARSELRAATWWACSGSHRVVHTAQHLHGGIGADIDYPIHRFFLWAKHIGLMLGGADQQLAKLGQLLAEDDSLGFQAMTV